MLDRSHFLQSDFQIEPLPALGEGAAGGILMLAPELSGLTKVGGGLLLSNAADQFQSLFTGTTGYEAALRGIYGDDAPGIRDAVLIKDLGLLPLAIGSGFSRAYQPLFRSGQIAIRTNVFEPAAEFFSAGTGQTYRVFKRMDIDWKLTRTAGDTRGIGLTNAEAAERFGLPPQLDDGFFATLHHSQQNALGPFFEASTRYHNISKITQAPLHPYGVAGHPLNPMGRGLGSPRQLFQDIEVPEYWMWRAMMR